MTAILGVAFMIYALFLAVFWQSVVHPQLAADSLRQFGVVTLLAGVACLTFGILAAKRNYFDGGDILTIFVGGVTIFGGALMVAASYGETAGIQLHAVYAIVSIGSSGLALFLGNMKELWGGSTPAVS